MRYLKYGLAAAELRSMRRVARTLGVRETTVSRNIGALEQQLDIQIFQRHNTGIRLTDEGRDWIESVRDHYEGLEEDLSKTAQRHKNTEQLHIGLSAPFGRAFIVRLVWMATERGLTLPHLGFAEDACLVGRSLTTASDTSARPAFGLPDAPVPQRQHWI
ncbi:MAG TPA: hypothetical protein DEO85_07595 [Maritimibacter sp.]|nr:hypothetical protein [Maritimibacter sp.]